MSPTMPGQDRPHHIVTFNVNSGTFTGPAQVFVLEGHTVDRPANPTPTMPGDGFTGWYTTADLTVQFDFNAPIAKPITLFAGWLSKQGHPCISFDANGGILGGLAQVFVLEGHTVDRPANPTPTIPGDGFTGWYTTADLTTQLDFNAPIEKSITLFAGWLSKQGHPCINFDANGGILGELERVFVRKGHTADRPANPTPTIPGDGFTGWHTTADLTAEFDFNTPIAKPITLFAGWLSKQGHPCINFDANGGTLGGPARVLARKGHTVDRPTNPKRNGHAFADWYADSGASENKFDFNTPITEPITLYAKWDYDGLMKTAWIAPGIFTMGQAGVDRAEPVHQVMLTKGFHMGIYPVTQEQYKKVMGENPSHFQDKPSTREKQGLRPVECVRCYDAIAFCNRLSIQEGFDPVYIIAGTSNPDAWLLDAKAPTEFHDDKSRNLKYEEDMREYQDIISNSDAATANWSANGYRLPTEAEWEFAARAGTATQWSFGDTDGKIGDYAWHEGNSDGKTHQVGLKKPNAWGLHDMHGNVWEWVWDRHKVYSEDAQVDPRGGSGFVMIRGGSWNDAPEDARSAIRGACFFFVGSKCRGFRVVRP